MKKRFWIALGVVAVVAVAGSASIAWSSLRRQLRDMLTLDVSKSYTDEFHVKVVEVRSESGSFLERIQFTCEKDMDVGIRVIDLKKTGVHEVHDANGAMFYRVGNPYKAGLSGPVHPDGKSSACEILYTVSTTPSNTIWHSTIGIISTNGFSHHEDSHGVDTTLPTPMTVSEVQTNWSAAYRRDSWIPLAALGDYKIMLTVK